MTAHAGGQERLGDRRVAVPDQQSALQCQADVLGDLAGPVLQRLDVAEGHLERVQS